MANGDASQADFRTIWATLELDETVRIDATVASGVAHDWRDTLRNSLPQLPLGEADDAQFKIAGVIGRGGMGVVHEAKQRSLARAVAIKTVPDDKVSRLAENALLQEARVMGMVEHPNVVPVHIIGQDER
jgi:serine/threonine protein kinase